MKKKFSLIPLGIILLTIDQLTKYLVRTSHVNEKIIDGFFEIMFIRNYGVALNILNNKYLIIILLNIVLFLFLLYIFFKSSVRKYDIILMIIMSGAIGNIIDRLMFGYVTDFISFQINNYYFPIFNFADIYLTIGSVVLIAVNLWDEKKGKNDKLN